MRFREGGGGWNKSEAEKLRRLQFPCVAVKLTGKFACAANGAKSS